MAVSIERIDRRARFPRPSLANMSREDRPRTGGPNGADPDPQPEEGRRVDPVSHRTDVVRRLLDRGVPVRALEALLPGWEGPIAEALEHRCEPPG